MNLQFADTQVSPVWWLLIGGAKAGKTSVAATISAKAPKVPSPTPVYLDDTLFVNFDTDGLKSLQQQKLIPYSLDYSLRGTTYKDLLDVIREVPQLCAAAVKENGIKNIVIDPISTLDTILQGHHRKMVTNAKDSQMLWAGVLKDHMDFALMFRGVQANIIFTAHTQNLNPVMENDSTQINKMVSTLPGIVDIGAEITGKSARFYKRQVSAIFAVLAKKEKGKPARHTVLTEPLYGYEVGHRYKGLLPEEEPHLYSIWSKVEQPTANIPSQKVA
jgi:hypothetical protein